jgi:hypothetical protein
MLGVSGVFLIALFAVATAGPRIPFVARLRGEAAPPPAGAPPVALPLATQNTITAAELWAAYGANAAAADAKWKGKPVEISGTVVDVRRDFRGKTLVRLATGDALETVHAAITVRETDPRAVPARGQTLALACTGAGRAIGAPLLESCRPL